MESAKIVEVIDGSRVFVGRKLITDACVEIAKYKVCEATPSAFFASDEKEEFPSFLIF